MRAELKRSLAALRRILFNDYQLSKDGLEMTFALNHMGYFGLAFSLLDLPKSTKGARVVSTSNVGHK